ncbi:nucleobase:cation symporter-2 family protein [Pandoraea fibrosis]|uniref:Purine permease n=1 Tax=Pandoraea fibrosis TaxID=1891094 RepID=A0A5E4YGL6_9BURK|nr:nucleobase:cation symporter-2 family protein [Pandoraea fibrosis]VVE47871.1 purine permease [Pandoraea fibrosis]
MTQSAAVPVHPVDERLPLPKLFTLGLQHVLVMYAGAVAVPLIVGGALKMSVDQIAFLINADLFACGIATLIQTLGLWIFGLRLPIMMGVTFTAVTPMIAIGTNPDLGLLDIYGATIAAGIIGILIAPFIGKLLRLFPPVVTGTVITVIGISLMGVGINWAAGGFGNPDYGNPLYLGVSFAVLLCILFITKYVRGFFSNIAVLLGILFGTIVAIALGKVSFAGVSEAAWFGFVMPFHFGAPRFDPIAIATMTLVMLVTFIESTGMFLAVGDIVGRPVDQKTLVRGLRVDGLGTVIGGIFNTFPYTSFSQNVGLVGVTGVKSRWVCAMGGLILIVLGMFPKVAHVVASVPQFVLGGAGIVMFGMVTATGVKILSTVDLSKNRYNLYIIAISIGVGMIPVASDKFFMKLPHALAPFFHSGILLASISAVLLNAHFNGLRSEEEASALAQEAGKQADAAH